MKNLLKKLDFQTIQWWGVVLLVLAFVVFCVTSCQKTDTRAFPVVNLDGDELYGFGTETYKGKPIGKPCRGNSGKPCPPPPTDTTIDPPPPVDTTVDPPTDTTNYPPSNSKAYTVLIDTDGHFYTGGYWTNMLFEAADESLNVPEVLEIVRTQYKDYNIVFTTDEAVFNQANQYARIRVVLTSTQDRNGSGYAYVGSGFWGPEVGQREAPMALVYSSNLQNYSFYVGEIASHEIGHTLNLVHVNIWNADCSINQQYLGGYVMGNGTYGGDSQWHPGHPCRYQGGAFGRSDDAVLAEGIGRR